MTTIVFYGIMLLIAFLVGVTVGAAMESSSRSRKALEERNEATEKKYFQQKVTADMLQRELDEWKARYNSVVNRK